MPLIRLTGNHTEHVHQVFESWNNHQLRFTSWSKSDVLDSIVAGQVYGFFEDKIEMIIVVNDVIEELEILFLLKFKSSTPDVEIFLQVFAHFSSAQSIWLEVHEENQGALKFYESRGFKEVGRRKHYYGDGGAAVIMSLSRTSQINP